MNDVFLSVVIPCYNEEENLKKGVLGDVCKFLSTKDFKWEVIVSDDGSTDKSREIISKQIKSLNNFSLLCNPHGGKPCPLLSGIRKAKGKYILFADMDQSTPINQLDKLLPYVNNFPVVIGSRGMSRENFPFYRKVGAVVFMSVRRIMILNSIKDTQCGFKLFKKSVLLKTFPLLEYFKTKSRAYGWKVTSYDVELLHLIEKLGVSIKEVTVVWDDKDASTSKGGGISRYIRESKEMLMQILRVKINDLKGQYKI